MIEWLIVVCIVIFVLLKFWRPGSRPVSNFLNTIEGEKRRTLGLLERWYSASHDAGVTIVFGFVCQLSGKPPSKSNIVNAIKYLIGEKYPSLSCVIVDEHHSKNSEKPYFIQIPYDEFDKIFPDSIQIIERKDSEMWKSILIQEHTKKLDVKNRKKPLWRISLIQNNEHEDFELIFHLHHAIADGMSAMNFVKDVIELLDSGKIPDSKPPKLEEFTCIENFLDTRGNLLAIFQAVKNDRFPPKDDVYRGPKVPEVHPDERKCEFEYIVLTEDETSRINERSRANGTTFQGYLCAASQLALLDTFGEEKIHSVCGSAVNLRPYLEKKVKMTSTPMITATESHYLIDRNTDIWTLARQSKKDIADGIVSAYQTLGMLRFVDGSWINFFEKKKTKFYHGRDSTVHPSNLGRFELSTNNLKVKSIFLSNAKASQGPLISVNAVTVNGAFNCQIGVSSPGISVPQLKRYTEILKKMLISC